MFSFVLEIFCAHCISSILSKVLDYIIIDNQKLALQTSDYQFRFKSKSSTVLCTTMVTEPIQYYTENGCKGVFLLLLDASKAFDKVVLHMLFNELIKKNVCTKIIKLLLYIDGHESKPANSNFSIFFLFDKFEGNTFLHNVLKNLVPSMLLYPSFRQLSNRLSHTETLFNETKPARNLHSATTTISDTNIIKPL